MTSLGIMQRALISAGLCRPESLMEFSGWNLISRDKRASYLGACPYCGDPVADHGDEFLFGVDRQ